MSEPHAWWEDHSERLAFANYLADNGYITTIEQALYYFEKPWKWESEHTYWALAGWEKAEGYIDTTDYSDPENQEATR